MAEEEGPGSQATSSRAGEPVHGLSVVERPILLLRGLALLLAIVLHLFDRSTAGVIFPVPKMVLVLLGYNLLLLLIMQSVRWLRRPLNFLAIDTVVAAATVYLTGGYHSSFYVLFVFITIGAAFQLELARTVIVTLAIGLIYVGACYVNPAGLAAPPAQYILAAKVLILLVVSVLCGLLLEQLRREHSETERERAMARRLQTLNDLFQTLNTNLDLDLTLQTVVEAPRALLDANWTSIALLDEGGETLSLVAAAGADLASLDQHGWRADDPAISAILSGQQPYVVKAPAAHLQALPVQLAEGVASPGIRSVVSVPLSLEKRPLGLLDVAYGQAHTPSREDLAFLQALGQEAALAIRNARLYELERQQVARLRDLDEMQRGFVSAVSHELRTPLTCIKTSVDLLAAPNGEIPQDQEELIRTIGHHVGRLEGLVTDLLETTKLEAGQITLSKQLSDLRRLAGRAVDTLGPLRDSKRQQIDLHLPERLTLISLDRRRIEQVLVNVLSNAIRFTPKEGQIDVRISEATGTVRLCVSDNGPGIPEEELPHLFDRFYVVADDRGLSGLGLGLYIAREMIELHEGRIWVESELGTGSTFCFELPKKARGKES